MMKSLPHHQLKAALSNMYPLDLIWSWKTASFILHWFQHKNHHCTTNRKTTHQWFNIKTKIGTPGWLCRWSVLLLISAPGMISGSWDWPETSPTLSMESSCSSPSPPAPPPAHRLYQINKNHEKLWLTKGKNKLGKGFLWAYYLTNSCLV